MAAKGQPFRLINASSEIDYLYRGLRALVGFEARATIARLRHGHLVRRRAIRSYLASHERAKLHLGASVQLNGFLNSQILGTVPIDITHRFRLPDESFDLIYSSHLVEHIHQVQLRRFLSETLRILKPGGIHIVATPSIEKIALTVYAGGESDKQTLLDSSAKFYNNPLATPAEYMNLAMRAFGHRFLVDFAYMSVAGKKIGYESVERIGNSELPDETLAEYVRTKKPRRWHLETETFVLKARRDPPR